MAGADHDDFRRVRSPFEGRLIRLRAVEEDDLPAIHDLFNAPAVQETLAIDWLQPQEGTRGWWEGTRRNPHAKGFVVETLAGELVGVCSLEDVRSRSRSAELGIWIGEPYWDRGFGTDAVRTICRFGFDEMNLHRIHLYVYDNNPRGRRAYEKVGFKEEGRHRDGQFVGGRFVDVISMSLLAGELIEG